MPYFLEGNCVRKGTKEEPGEVVKCHEDHDSALAHLRALYVNVEDAGKGTDEEDKGGPGSGWHNPPKGTHTAENAPNFAGGPGADREYGTESDEPPKGTKRCKCSKCGAVTILPKGKQCSEIKCGSCGGEMSQTEPREDKPAGGEEGRAPGAGRRKAVHGEGGMLSEVASVAEDGAGECKCPHCDKALPCTAVACPYCKERIDREERGEGDKAMDEEGELEADKSEWSSAMVNDLPDSCFLYVESGEKDDGGKTTPRSKRHLPYKNAGGKVDLPHLRNAISRLGQSKTGSGDGGWLSEDLRKRLLSKAQGILSKHGGGEKASWTVYKSADGTWRWLALCNWAVVDKEAEVVSEKAYLDGIAKARQTGQWGSLDLVHVSGTDVGDCDLLFTTAKEGEPAKLGAGGPFWDSALADGARRAVQADPDYWGMSIKFRYNPQRKVKGIYTGDIEFLKYTILPQAMAASYGTAIAVQGGEPMSKELDEKTREALARLNVPEETIAELAEKQKALPPEENVVEKEEGTGEEEVKEHAGEPEPSKVKQLIAQLAGAFGIGTKQEAPVASAPEEAGKANEVADPAKAAEPADTKQAGGEPEGAEEPGELLHAFGAQMAKSLGELVKQELAERDGRIAALEETIKGLNESVEEKVAQRLRDVPPVVRVAASQVDATTEEAVQPKGLTFGQRPAEAEKYTRAFLDSVQTLVEREIKGEKYKV